jgi:hypothetical protein
LLFIWIGVSWTIETWGKCEVMYPADGWLVENPKLRVDVDRWSNIPVAINFHWIFDYSSFWDRINPV